jgi:uncharacterized protein YeaO (DUF488 family)
MSVQIVRLGGPRLPDEGVRIGTVRRPPRGVRKERYTADDWFDVWFPDLAPSSALMAQGKTASDIDEWARFAKAYRAEMSQPTPSRTLDLLAALSHQSRFSVGCYCADESRCHRSILRELLAERGASFG